MAFTCRRHPSYIKHIAKFPSSRRCQNKKGDQCCVYLSVVPHKGLFANYSQDMMFSKVT